MDETDPFHIYRINNGSMNNGSDYVFKFSKFIAENIAVRMDINKPYNILQEENAYFDATHTRVHSFKSFGLWTYHPTMHQTIRLASMEMRSENTNDISTFFMLLNEVLREVTGKEDYMFNPRCFMCDEGGANYNAIKKVYGEEFCAERVRGCQFHFKNSVNQRSNKIMLEDQATFKQICKKLCEATTVAIYHVLKGRLDDMANKYEFLEPWIDWWHQRRSHFWPLQRRWTPSVNLSEQGNSKWVRCNTMRLVHAAHDDVATMIVQEEEIYEFDRNILKSGGRGPSVSEHAAKDKSQQTDVAVDFVNIRDNMESVRMQAAEATNPTSYIPKKKDHFKPVIASKKEKKIKKRKVTFVTGEQKENQLSKAKDILMSKSDAKRSKAKKVATEIITEEEIQRKIDDGFKLIEIEKRKLIEDEKKKQKLVNPNPPIVIFTNGLGISVCKGCTKKKIEREEITYPHNMVFRRRGIVGYYNKILNKFINGEVNVHFHLKKSCLRNADQTLEFKDITMTDEVFAALSSEQMEVLKNADILQYILANKNK